MAVEKFGKLCNRHDFFFSAQSRGGGELFVAGVDKSQELETKIFAVLQQGSQLGGVIRISDDHEMATVFRPGAQPGPGGQQCPAAAGEEDELQAHEDQQQAAADVLALEEEHAGEQSQQ